MRTAGEQALSSCKVIQCYSLHLASLLPSVKPSFALFSSELSWVLVICFISS